MKLVLVGLIGGIVGVAGGTFATGVFCLKCAVAVVGVGAFLGLLFNLIPGSGQ